MDPKRIDDRIDDARETRYELAADWLQRLDEPHLSQEDLQAWLEWFDASDENRKAFEELQTLRQRFRVLPQEDREELKRRVGDAAPEPRASTPTRSKVYGPWSLAAAISALAIGITTWWITQTQATETYIASADRHRTVVLGDGSSVVLGANSVVDVTYLPTQRFVTIQHGEAYFEVEHSRFRPFTVQAGDVRVTAVGTAFNVQRRSSQVAVTVTEGKVRVSPSVGAPHVELKPGMTQTLESEIVLAVGQQAVVSMEPPALAMATSPSAPAADWSGDHVSFINAPLREVLPIINRHASTKLTIDDPRVGDLTYSGTIFRSHLDEWIVSLPRAFPVRAVSMEDGSTTLVSRDPNDPR